MNLKAAHIEDVYELSPLQQGMLFHTVRDPAASMYFHQVTYTLHGQFDVPAFRRAWHKLAEHQPALRTSYHWANLEKPAQVVHRQAHVPFEEFDWRDTPASEHEARLQEWLKQDEERGFVMTQPPLMRVTVIRIGDNAYHFVWSQHHILWDGWSGPLVLKDLLAYYEGERHAREYLPIRPRPFRDYIAWLRQQDAGKAEAFWRRTLSGFSTPTPLSIDRLGGARNGEFAGAAEERLHLPAKFMTSLQNLARQHQLTLNTVLQGAWAILLGRYAGKDDVVFGASVSGRPAGLAGVESMVGLFINTVPVRVRLPEHESILTSLKRLQAEQAELRQFEHSPLVQVQGWSEVPRGMPLFESMVVFVNYAADRVAHERFGHLKVLQVRQAVQHTDCPLGLVVVPGEELWLRLVFDTGRIERSAAIRLLEHLRRVLESVVANPAQRLSDVSLLTPGDRKQLVVDWNATATAYPADACVHDLVARQAAHQPDVVALTFHGQTVTYRELDHRANQLAHHLRTLGLRVEDRVALSVDRSLEMVVAILGVLKAGGSYVPIDPVLPAERQSFMLQDSGVKILLTQEHHCGRLPIGHIPVVYLDSDWPTIAKLPDESPPAGAGPSNLAYIIYTSGSTGQPKGVLVEHRGLTNVVCAQVQTYGIRPSSRILQVISLSFDVAQAEILRALVGGATLVLATSEELLPGWPLLNILRDERVTFAGILPAPLSAMPLGEDLPDLRNLLVGGEQCPVELAAHWGKDRDIFNGYGPTEATVCTTIARNWDLNAPAPVGRPIANTRVYVLDKRLQPVPVGVPGELHIGGIGVTRGYMHQPAFTAERFLPDLYGERPDARMYRTGDLMRWLDDGNLEFIGRIDGQIKLRGFRIELGEIETVLGQHPNVLNAAAMVREDEPADKRLVAYIVAQREPAPTAPELRTYLKGKLPEYMVPAAFVFMRELPRTTNDKVDRRLLPVPDPEDAAPDDQLSGPRTPTEELVAGVWCDLLKVSRVGVNDNFFELGGHSLLATQAVSRLRTAFNVDLSLRSFFESSTVAGVTEKIEAARREAALASQLPPLVPVARDGDLPLSFAQQRLWFFDQLEPGNLFYSLPTAIRLTGKLDIGALERALTEIIRRHEVLRTTYVNREGRPVQVISPSAAVTVPVTDLSELPVAERETEARRLANEEANKPHDLERGPLVRVRLLRLAAEEHVLLLSMHHIASDGWSMAIFFRELGTLYEAFAEDRPSPLADLPVQYADFAVWQRQWLQGQVLENQLAYWRDKLAGVSPLELPTDHVRPAEQRFTGAHETVQLPVELNDKLKALSRREGVTPFMTFLAAFQILLSRYSRQVDVSVGTPIAGRNLPETEGLIGFFVNTLVMRTDLSGNPTFRALLKRVREVCLGAYDHQDIPFEKLVEELHPQRELGHNPIFQVLFVLQNAPRATRELQGVTLSRLDADFEPPAKFDLTLGMAENPDGIRTTLKYNAELFDAATIRRMLTHLQTLLEGIVAHPEWPLAKLPLMPEAERRQILVDWNATDTAHPDDRCVHSLFEDQTATRPDAVALCYYGTTWTYGELNRRANRLARHLRRLGVGPERTVALVLDRSPEMILGVLAVLKAGGAYVPLDSGQPAERLAFMLKDAQATAALTQNHMRQTVPQSFDGHIVELDRLDSHVLENGSLESEQNFPRGAGPDSLAYIIFTSGSTGQPKGVLVSHRGLTNVVIAQNKAFGIDADSRVMQYVSLHFDAAQGEIFRTLCAGATLFLARSEDLIPGPDMARLYRDLHITSATLPTSVMAALPENEPLPELRHMSVGGEACPATKAAVWAPGRRFFNGYGPTEATICTTLATGWDTNRTPPIGRPIANVKLYVLDNNLRPVPTGVPGELYVGGIGVARGYLHRPDLTAAGFLPDLYSGRPGARMYRTGDFVRWLADGQLDFLGRVDEQVKIRGFRIELGEIENTLLRHPSVADCAVTVVEDNRGDKQIVAFVAAGPKEAPSTAELREFLRQSLPEYMLPATFVPVPSIPRKLNGKVDRKHLPSPDFGQSDVGEYMPPRNPAEELVASIWAEVLRRDRVSTVDNFFDIGGHSLLATQVVSRLRSAFGVEVSLRALFETPTVAGLAVQIEKSRLEACGLQAPPLRPVPRDRSLPLSFAQQRLWFLDQLEPGNLHYAIPLSIRLTGALTQEALERALTEILRRHEVLRTTFPMRDGEAAQVIAPAVLMRLAITDVSDFPVSERETQARVIASEEARQPFDLASGPLMRARLLRLGPQDHALLLSLHHIVSDGWSMTIFFRELGTLYEAFIAEQPSPLADVRVQYADFAVWQREWLQGSALETQLSYWKERLAGVAELELPTDRPRPAVHRYRGANYSVRFSAELSAKLQTFSRQEGATLFMTLLAAFQVLLSRYGGQDDISVGTPIAGRNRAETEDLVGFFVNTLVLRGDLGGDPTFKDFLARVREVCLGAYAHQDLPFEKLVDELQIKRDLGRSPLFQVFFVLQNAPKTSRQLSGLTLSRLGADVAVAAKFDLTLGVTETDDGLGAVFKYNADLFDEATVRRMMEHWETLLEQIVVQPTKRLSELSLLSDAERRLLTEERNQTATPYPSDRCIHELFAEQARSRPDSVALLGDDWSLTYRTLDRRANHLANRLRKLGIGPENRVAIAVERSPEAVIGFLGVLKAGGAYVPLNPAYSPDRLAFILEDSGVKALLRQAHLSEKLPAFAGPVIDLEPDTASSDDDGQPESGVGPSNLAYILYTSGTSGRPKGVLIEHGGLTNVVCAQIKTWDIRPDDRIVHFLNLSFDAAQAEIFRGLVSGATLYLPPRDMVPGRPFIHALRARRVTLYTTLPSVLSVLPMDEELPELRMLTLGGEACPKELAAHWGKGRRMLNGYGPTETTICTTIASQWPSDRPPPIGKPIANSQTYVLDPRMRPVPVGLPGELYVGGVGVARGYGHQPDVTAERFVPDPFSRRFGGRLYRTGDLVRWLPDGNLEFLGRVDEQVKVRGYRIEPAEIEAALGQHTNVKHGVVLAREDTPGDKRLVAYVVAQQVPAPSESELRRFLKGLLPEYMVPSAFVFLAEMPLTPNGKADRKALPVPDETRPELEQEFVAPRTTAESTLANIWSGVLKVDRVGVHDNFFELGGDSIRSIQVIARATQAGLRLTAKDLFQQQTVAELAAVAEAAGSVAADQGPVIGQVPLTPTQLALFESDPEEPHHDNLAILWEVRQPLDADILNQAFRHIQEHHDALRLRFGRDDSTWKQLNAGPEAVASLLRIDLSATADSASIEAECARIQTSLNLADGPVIQLAYFNLGSANHGRLLLVVHRLVADGTSVQIIMEDLIVAYQQLHRGQPVRLPPKTTSFQQWARRLAERAQSDELNSEREFWLDAARTPSPDFPVDYPGAQNTCDSVQTVTVELERESTRTLGEEVSQAYRVEVVDVLLTALIQAVESWSGGQGVRVDLETSSRNLGDETVDLNRTVGCLTHTYPFVSDVQPESAPADALIAVKERRRETPGGGMGYGLLRYLNGETLLAESPNAPIHFAFNGGVGDARSTGPLAPAAESPGSLQSEHGNRRHLLGVTAAIVRGKLRVQWGYSRNLHEAATIETLARRFIESLTAIIDHCRSADAGELSAADFPAARVSDADLSKLLSQLGQASPGSSS